jgi:hypothetical protein
LAEVASHGSRSSDVRFWDLDLSATENCTASEAGRGKREKVRGYDEKEDIVGTGIYVTGIDVTGTEVSGAWYVMGDEAESIGTGIGSIVMETVMAGDRSVGFWNAQISLMLKLRKDRRIKILLLLKLGI